MHAQTTLSAIVVDGQQYDITYRDSVVFDNYETAISSNGSGGSAAPWWNASNATANAFATAVYNSNNSLNNIRFAHKTATVFETEALYASTYNGGAALQTNVYAQNATGNYAISAVAVPAPLPILGILPIVGFLKRMRKRQRAS
ncbi:hypothetical protein OAF75_01830 [Verrucomicrobiales bacterium]|nr:hypothetical protein [Verrucomicrobiales bacterium]